MLFGHICFVLTKGDNYNIFIAREIISSAPWTIMRLHAATHEGECNYASLRCTKAKSTLRATAADTFLTTADERIYKNNEYCVWKII